MNVLPLHFLMLIFAGWVNRHQQNVIGYLQEENKALREQLGGKRLRFTDQQRRRLAAKARCVPEHSGAGALQLQHHSPCPPDAYPASHRSIPRHSLGLGMHPIRRELGDDRIPRSEEHFIRSVPFECGMRHHFVVRLHVERDEAPQQGKAQ
jgi:hypothetical protein